MSYRFDTDHITILQRQAGPEFAAIMAHIALHAPSELAFSIISLHEQTLGCHTYINQARTSEATIRGYRMLNQVLGAFVAAPGEKSGSDWYFAVVVKIVFPKPELV